MFSLCDNAILIVIQQQRHTTPTFSLGDAVLFISSQCHTTPTFSLCDAVLFISIQRHTTPTFSLCDAVLFISIQRHTTPMFNLCDAVLVISIQRHTTPTFSLCDAVLLTVAFRDGRTVRLGEKVDEVHDVVYAIASRQQFAPVPWIGRVPIGGWQLLHAHLSAYTQHLSVLFITRMRACTP